MNRFLLSGAAATAVTAGYITCNEPSTYVESHSIKEKDINDELLKKRRIFLNSSIDINNAKKIISQLLALDSAGTEPITLIINSGGGSITDGLAIYDTIQLINSPVHTLCTGRASSMASIILSAGAKGGRYATEHSRIMIHSARNSVPDKTSVIDLKILTKELDIKNDILIGILKRHTGRTEEEIRKDIERDYFLTPNCAKEIGLIDNVLLPGDGFPDTKA